MTPFKRLIDILSALVLGTVLLPLILWVALLILLREGRPIFFVSERMKTPDKAFGLVKFRTMHQGSNDGMATGGDKTSRVTATGAMLRAKRLDELPQLWNLLLGHVSLVGPRPPLRRYVERFPEIYSEVLKARPGITGLASLVYHKHEALLLSRCKTPEETDRIYARACVPRKAALDVIYRDNHNVCWDFSIMFQTVFGRR
ncbi:lipopolysaccharide/colanic/teichoic acid biosynthesis glycosyltransferase [Shimia isoporae]|uniref:Lipopolysaccharide/colanic/teichoic acid biosynthesis glycosyltransferase n=1 Tax=Shimia isoporae TaxID=647720 RepID=A0A4R1N1D4_9RHOB|nr:sugar transferase [Shimia isoporae]TCK99847.1 lipopolysaccharide/colanic/teichoic acid biosynthesis glycosyltransferase [Shimia isoporae]